MLEETDRLTRMVEDLLVLARGDAGSAGLHPVPVDLSETVLGILEELKVLAEEKSQKIETRTTAGIMVTADVSTLTLAISNVLHNAIRYTPDGGR